MIEEKKSLLGRMVYSGVARVYFIGGHTEGHLLFLGGHTYHMIFN